MLQDTNLTSRRARALAFGAAALLLGVHAAMAWAGRGAGVQLGGDDARFILLAREIGSFAYHDSYVLGSPAHGHFPPLYPVMLAVWAKLFGESYRAVVLLNIGLSVTALAFLFAAVARVWSPVVGLLCLVPLVVNPDLVARAGSAFSEPAFTMLTLLALWTLARRDPAPRLLVVAGAAAISAALTRSIGVALLAAVIVHWALEHRWRPIAILTVIAVAAVGGWLLWSTVAPRPFLDAAYTQGFADYAAGEEGAGALTYFVRLLPGKLARGAKLVQQAVSAPGIPRFPLDNLIVLGSLLAGLGAFLRKWRPAAAYVLFYGALLLAWPYLVERLLEPLIPLMVAAIIVGVLTIFARWKKVGAAAAAAVALTIAVVGFVDSRELAREQRACGDSFLDPPRACLPAHAASYFEALAYVRQDLPLEAILLTSKGPVAYYYTGRKTAPYPEALSRAPERFIEYLRSTGVDFILLSRLHESETDVLAGLLDLNCRHLEVEARFLPDTYLFRLRGADEHPLAAGSACRDLAEFRRAARDPLPWEGEDP